jgi:hypothetical protein
MQTATKAPRTVPTEDPTPAATKDALKHMSLKGLYDWADKHEMRNLCSTEFTKTYGRSWERAYLFLWRWDKDYYELLGIRGIRLD